MRATGWILTQRRRGAMADAASSLRSLRLCGESKVARGDAALTCGPLGSAPTRPTQLTTPSARTARERRTSPERPLIHRRGAKNAEKRLHPP
jgi:hypothetical protein